MHFTPHFRHWLWPHKHNDHRPYLIRRLGLALVALVILGVQIAGYTARPAHVRSADGGKVLAYASNITPSDVFNLTNQQRAAAGLPPLRMDARLNQSASLKAQNMLQEDYWAHVSPGGTQPWHWFATAGYSYRYAGENLAKDFDTSSGAVDGWMNSAGHRANLLGNNYTSVGFAVINGTLQGTETTLVVAHYGAPYAAPAPTSTPPAPNTPKTSQPKPAVPPAPVQSSTPAPTPAATPAPVPGTAPIAPAATPSVTGQVTEALPAPKSYSLFAPLSLTRTLNWHTLITIILLVMLLGVYLLTHLTVWRKGLKRWRHRHYRGLAAFQVGGLIFLMMQLISTGLGSVG